MPPADPRVDAYIAKAEPFARPILERIRKSFHKGCPEIVEQIKWKHPSFEHNGIIGGMASHKAHVSLWFHRGAEVDDPDGIFDGMGEKQMAGARAEKLSDLPTQRVLASYVKRAAKLNEGPSRLAKKPVPRKPAPKIPAVVKAALAKNKKARTFYESLPPGAKRDYVEWVTTAKREATRDKRLATMVVWLSEGKRRNWKYENC